MRRGMVAWLCGLLVIGPACGPLGGSGALAPGGGGGEGGSVAGGGSGGGGSGSGGSGPGGSGGSGVSPSGPLVDPGCVDGRYAEVLPDPGADIADLTGAYQPANARDFVLDVLGRRYPAGRHVVAGALPGFDCITAFMVFGAGDALAVIRSMETIVHECGHIFDGSQGGARENAYVLTPSLTLRCDQGDAQPRGGLTFARSRIRGDDWSAARPPCSEAGRPCDKYADIYLDGDPDDGSFEGGDQGFNMLLEETVQYVSSLATGLAFSSELDGRGSTSTRDGILTFLWYVERYLAMARLERTSAYEHLLQGDGGCWRRAILTVWGRAWLYLEATRDMGHLGIDDASLQELVETPQLLGEIQRLRDAEGCPVR